MFSIGQMVVYSFNGAQYVVELLAMTDSDYVLLIQNNKDFMANIGKELVTAPILEKYKFDKKYLGQYIFRFSKDYSNRLSNFNKKYCQTCMDQYD